MIVGLHHAQVSIPIGAEEAARRFYCGILGLSEIAKPAELAERGGVWLAAGGVNILECVAIAGYQRLEFRDPFGNRVELIEPIR